MNFYTSDKDKIYDNDIVYVYSDNIGFPINKYILSNILQLERQISARIICINASAFKSMIKRLDIESIPTTLYLMDGKVVFKTTKPPELVIYKEIRGLYEETSQENSSKNKC